MYYELVVVFSSNIFKSEDTCDGQMHFLDFELFYVRGNVYPCVTAAYWAEARSRVEVDEHRDLGAVFPR